MKPLLQLFILILFLYSGCKSSIGDHLQGHKAPIIVVTHGTNWMGTSVTFIDADGNYFTIVDNSLASLQKGDTLLFVIGK